MSVVIAGDGTTERAWRPWLADRRWLLVDLDALAQRHVVVLAAHPDDEVLAVGGLLHGLARRGARLTFVWATAGEACHPESRAPIVTDLARLRRAEVRCALELLDVRRPGWHDLGLPDSAVAAHTPALTDALGAIVSDLGEPPVLLAPWRADGHPDHDTCGRVAADVAQRCGAHLIEYPVWAWHWAEPGDPRIPWRRARIVALDEAALAQKTSAVNEFVTQIAPIGPAPEDAAVLSPAVLERFARDTEMVFG